MITHPLLVGTDGADKMSKSLGNAIGISDPPEDIYGKVMSISDAQMLDYYDLLAAGGWQELASERARLSRGEGDPLSFKHALAARIVERFQGPEGASAAAAHFEKVVQRKEVPVEVPELRLVAGASSLGLLTAIVQAGLARSNGEARRLVAQGGVSIDGERVEDPTQQLARGGPYLIRVGKRRFVRLEID